MFKGSIAALATPFDAQGEVDYTVLAELIEWHIESGTDAVVLCGTTGEAPTLSFEEMVGIFRAGVLAARGRIPIIAGTGSYDTRKAVELTQQAQKAGAEGALVILPYYSRPTPEGCFQHFQELSKVGLPLIIYHHPGRSGFKLPVNAMARLASLPCVVGIKDATADPDYVMDLMHQVKTPVFSGDDTLIIPLMASGAVGDISIVANLIPRAWKQLTTLLLEGHLAQARELFSAYYPLVKSMVLETNPQCVKFALGMMGKCSPTLRLPLVQPQEEVKRRIADELSKLQLI